MHRNLAWLGFLILGIAIVAVAWGRGVFAVPETPGRLPAAGPPAAEPPAAEPPAAGSQQATFGAGCFWCTEAVFQRVKGVHSVVSGYTGGTAANPTYEEVCSGTTGHAEAVQVTYDPNVVSYAELLKVFWTSHDPTTLNRQGHDVGTQYRSAIFCHNDEQRRIAEEIKEKLNAQGAFAKPIVTEIVPYTRFYPAETYHQDFYNRNPRNRYCAVVIRPKLEKLEKVFGAQHGK